MRKPAPPRELPPPLELCCLRALWRIGEGNVHAVREAVQAEHQLAYTTVLTLLDRLARRGFAERRKQNRSFVYTPLLEESRGREIALQELLNGWFEGDRDRLAAHLSNGAVPSPDLGAAARVKKPVVEERIDTALL